MHLNHTCMDPCGLTPPPQHPTMQCVPFRRMQRDSVQGLASRLLAEPLGQVSEHLHDMRRMVPPKSSAPLAALTVAAARFGTATCLWQSSG